jgi:hypothetical protein
MSPQTMLAWLFFSYSLLLIFGIGPAWSAAAQAYGRFPAQEARLMLYYRFISVYSYMLYLPLTAMGFMVATNVFGLSSIPWVGVAAMGLFQLYIYMYQILPPTVIYLGTSNARSAVLRYRMDRGINPYRIVVLLDPSTEASASAFYRNYLEWDNLRTNLPWEPVVHVLMEKVPRIAMDTRVASPAVVHESRRVCSRAELLAKTLFIVDDTGAAPSLVVAGITVPDQDLRTVQEADVIRALRDSGLTRVASPDDHPWMKELMNDRR